MTHDKPDALRKIAAHPQSSVTHLGYSSDQTWEYELVDITDANRHELDDYEYEYAIDDSEYVHSFIEPELAQRRVILATNIAETSITIEGITTVVDSGLCKRNTFNANSGVTKLITQNISQASSIQRAGRAGRTAPGVCYRLWTKTEQQSLSPFESPEILNADLSHLVLNLFMWGNTDYRELHWLNTPMQSQIQQAITTLVNLKALVLVDNSVDKTTLDTQLNNNLQLTPLGQQLCQLPLPPRLASLCIHALNTNQLTLGCTLATILDDPKKSGTFTDISEKVNQLMLELNSNNSSRCAHFKQLNQQRKRYQQLVSSLDKLGANTHFPTIDDTELTADISSDQITEQKIALLIAYAWPERIAQKVAGKQNEYKLANGRRALLAANDKLTQHTYLAVSECIGQKHNENYDRIISACPLRAPIVTQYLTSLTTKHSVLYWHSQEQKLISQDRVQLGELVLTQQQSPRVNTQQKRNVILDIVKEKGLSTLDFNAKQLDLLARARCLYQAMTNNGLVSTIPNVMQAHLLATVDQWLAPFLSDDFVQSFSKIKQLKTLNTQEFINFLLPYPILNQVQEQAPSHICVPSGSNIKIDYQHNPPILGVKLQEMFGCLHTPTIAAQCIDGGIPLQIHLLSPAGKALQITQDIGNFWQAIYPQVKKEMKGRYPKHPWPDDPLNFSATKKTNRHL